MSTQGWMIVMLLAGGIFAGAVLTTAWERTSVWRQMEVAEYAIDFRRSVRRMDPAMPILLFVCLGATVGFALRSGGATRVVALCGGAQLVLIFLTSTLLAEPINSQFRRRPEGEVPPDAAVLRDRWRRFQLVRTLLALGAFGCLVVGASLH